MFDSVGGAWSTITGSPQLGFALLALMSVGIIFLLSGRNWIESIVGLFRVFLTIFTTPFVFLRDALAVIRTADEAERDYARTRVFMLFRYSRIQYMGILVGALLILSGGVTTSLLALYPKAELDRDRELRTQIAQIEADLQSLNQTASAAAQPGQRENMATARTQALNAYQRQAESNAAFLQTATFNDGIIYELANSRDVEAVARVRSRLDNYMTGCPPANRYAYRWQGFTADDCRRFREFVLTLATRKEREHNLRQAYSNVEQASRNAEAAQRQASARRASLQESLQGAEQQRASSTLTGGNWILDHVVAAVSVLLSSIAAVIIFIWLFALLVDIFNWLILMMRSLEKTQSEKLERAAADYQP